MGTQQFCLKWNNHHSNMLTVFEQLLSTEALVDVTLACDGLSLKAHKMVLSACSPFFQSLFLENPCKHPIVIMKDMRYSDLKAIIDFMYRGEVNVSHDQLSALLKTAETLKVKGLAEVSGENRHASGIVQQEIIQNVTTTPQTISSGPPSQQRSETPTLHSKRKRGRPRKRSLSDSNRSDNEDQVPSKIKEPDSPEIEELSGDASLEPNDIRGVSISSNSQSQVSVHPSLQTSTVHNALVPSKTHPTMPSIQSQDSQVSEEPTSGDEGDFEVEPSKLMEQTLTTDNVPALSNSQPQSTIAPVSVHLPLPSSSGLIDAQSRSIVPTASGDSQALVPVSVSIPSDSHSSSQMQGPDSPQDIKPALLSFEEPPISPVAGPSHQSDRSMMMYMDASGVPAIPGPSNYQPDNQTAITQHEQQPQGAVVARLSINSHTGHDGCVNSMLLNLPYKQLFVMESNDIWPLAADDEIEIVHDDGIRRLTTDGLDDEMEIEIVDGNDDDEDVIQNAISDGQYIQSECINEELNSFYQSPDIQTPDKIDQNTPLPEFSDFVSNHISENNLSFVWGTFVSESARYYLKKFPNIQNSSEYQAIGRKMYMKFPLIEREGKEPWSFFCRALSQRIRQMKWKIKRKKASLLSKQPQKLKRHKTASGKIRSGHHGVERRRVFGKQYKALLRELKQGWLKLSLNEHRIKSILKQTYKSRRNWIVDGAAGRLTPLLEQFPCFSLGRYVVYDFLLITGKKDTTELIQKLSSLFSTVSDIMKLRDEFQGSLSPLKILKFIEEQTAFNRGKGSFTKSVVVHKKSIRDTETMSQLKTAENTPPHLVVFTDGDEIKQVSVVGDKKIIQTETTSLLEALIVLLATYYTFNLEYPKIYSQFLGLLQTYVVGDLWTGIKSNKCTSFIKKLQQNQFFGPE